MPALSSSSAPTVSPAPVTRLKTPSGRPASRSASPNFQPEQRGVRGGLEHDGVAGDHRATGRSTGEGHREVEWADDAEDAVRAEDRPRLLRRRERAKRLHEALGLLELLAVVPQQVRGLLHVAERLESVLADLEGHERRVVELALTDQLGGAAQDGEAVSPRGVAPARECRAGGIDRVAHVLARPLRESRDDEVAIDRRAVLERLPRGAPRRR